MLKKFLGKRGLKGVNSSSIPGEPKAVTFRKGVSPGSADGEQRAAARGLEGEPQASTPPLTGGRAPTPYPEKAEKGQPADGSVRRHQAEHPHQMWAMDFQSDATADGTQLKFLNVIDEHSRLCLAIRVGRR